MDYLYRANDGTIFYNEDECADYERKLKYDVKAFNGVRLWNEYDKEFSLKELFDNNNNIDVINIWSIYFPNKEIAERFKEMIYDVFYKDIFDGCIPKLDKGLYTFNTDEDSWVNIEENLLELASRVKDLGFALNYELNFN